MLTKNSYAIATVGLIAAACLIAATIAVPIFTKSAHAQQRIVGASQSQGASQNANHNLAGINAAVGVQAQVGQVCVNALNSAPSCSG